MRATRKPLLYRAILSLLRSCLGPQTANWAILAGVFDITITFHHLLSPLRFYLWSDYTAHNPSILKCSLVYIVLTFKCDNQDIYCRLDDLGAEVGFEPTISCLMPQARTTKLLYSVVVIPAGFEPSITALKELRPDLLVEGTIYADYFISRTPSSCGHTIRKVVNHSYSALIRLKKFYSTTK